MGGTRPGGRIEGLDGLRGLAVLAVVAFHLWPSRVPGGFLGVDVFFVLSGFLITTLLLRERSRDGHVDLPHFWQRRARRLLPALVTVVTVSVAAAWTVSADLLVGIGRQVLGALTFSSNWLEAAAGSDYFDRTAPTLFETFWSLAVEEQFYLLWPIVFGTILALARTRRHRTRVALALAAGSALLMAILYTPGANPTRVYYGTDTHLFGLMLGAALAFASDGRGTVLAGPRWRPLRNAAGFAALAGLGVLVAVVDSGQASTYRGGIALASVLTAVVVACLPGDANALQAVHRLPPLVWVGQRSYGIYLWHWPVILIATAALPAVAPGAGPSTAVVVTTLVLTFGLSAASYRWIETPVRRDGFRALWRPFVHAERGLVPAGAFALGSVAAVLALAGFAVTTAPPKSAAQLAVERGQRSIAQAERASEVRPATPTTVTTVTAVPVPTDGAPAEPPAPPPAWPPGHSVPPGDLMVGFGDSVLSGAAPAMYQHFPGITLDAEPIRQWRDAPELVEQAVDSGTIRPVVVLNFGTNAGLKSEENLAALRQVLDILGPTRRIVLVNTVGVSNWVPSTNDTLAAISAEHPNAIVADWHAVVTADPTLLHSDRTHPNMRGIAVYADLIAQALEQLGP